MVWPPLAAAAELFVSSVALLISPRLLAKQRLTQRQKVILYSVHVSVEAWVNWMFFVCDKMFV